MAMSVRGLIRAALLPLSLAAFLAGCVPVTAGKTASPQQVRVAVAGDVWLRSQGSGASPFRYVGPLLEAADVAIINLEAPLTKRTAATPRKSAGDLGAKKHYLLKGSPARAHCLAAAGIDVVSLANNHAMDYLAGGCRDTIRLLDKLAVASVGAGLDVAAARRPAVVGARRTKVAVLSYLAFMTAEGLRACTPASAQHAGVAVLRSRGEGLSLVSRKALKCDIAAARKRAAIVIVAFHWGMQKRTRPTAYQRAVAHTAAELGASAVVGHHPHVLQGMEWHRGVPILYSLGNFVFSPSTGRLGETGVFILVFADGAPSRVDFHPARIRNCTPRPLYGDPARALGQRLLYLSKRLGSVEGRISEAGILTIPRP